MAYSITMHTDSKRFETLINLVSQHYNMAPAFVEKDYWITHVLRKLSQSDSVENVVFKGGTSLSKGYRLIDRFSEDIDLAMINENLSGNALKTRIRRVEKGITGDLAEISLPGISSKGSMFRKSLFEYSSVLSGKIDAFIPRRITVEINAFANPYPFIKQDITSFVSEFLVTTGRSDLVEQYGLQPFSLNVLDKRRTLVEKLVSLIRFSFSEDSTKAIASKIRHFYDLYSLAKDKECAEYLQSDSFKSDFAELLLHDQKAFDDPSGWQSVKVEDSPLVTKFDEFWRSLRTTYQQELTTLSCTPLPNEALVAESFRQIIKQLI